MPDGMERKSVTWSSFGASGHGGGHVLKRRQSQRFAPLSPRFAPRNTCAKTLYQLRFNHLSGARSGVPSCAMAKLLTDVQHQAS